MCLECPDDGFGMLLAAGGVIRVTTRIFPSSVRTHAVRIMRVCEHVVGKRYAVVNDRAASRDYTRAGQIELSG